MNRPIIKRIEDLSIGQTVTFVKEYTEHTLTKSGIISKKEDEIVYIQTDVNTIYKVIFADASFYVGTNQSFKFL